MIEHGQNQDLRPQSISLSLKEKFLSVVSHDLRTPLAVIKASADMVHREPNNQQLVELNAKRILRAIDRADAMIRNILDANRLEAGIGLRIYRTACDVQELIQGVVDDYFLVSQGRCDYGAREQIIFYCDPVALRRAIENLISNALKYGDSSTAVSVYAEDIGGEIKISVRNFGPTIPMEALDQLFHWHCRAQCPQQDEEGWGLGLMIVKGVAEAHGGYVSVESSAEKGTIFAIHLPRLSN